MPESPDQYAAMFTASLDAWDASRPRSGQRTMGVSSVGTCRSQALWMLTEVVPTDAPTGRQALMGTAAHKLIHEARANFNPDLILERELEITMPSGVKLIGHADEIDPTEPSVTDWKTLSAGADIVALRRNGANEQQRFQRHLYYFGAMQAGLVPPQGTVRNVWIDRSGQVPDPFVEQEPFDMGVIHQADSWFSDVLYAIEHDGGDGVPKEKHYEWCRAFCRFFSHCRQGTDHADLVVTDTELVAAAERTLKGRDLEKEGKALAEAGRTTLSVLQIKAGEDMRAYTLGEHRIRWTWVHMKDGSGYPKLTVERVP